MTRVPNYFEVAVRLRSPETSLLALSASEKLRRLSELEPTLALQITKR